MRPEMRFGLWVAVGTVLVLGALQASPFAAVDVPVLGPGLYTRTLERDAGPTIGCTISVPPTYNSGSCSLLTRTAAKTGFVAARGA